jgi:hypothetical protein
MFRHRNSSLTPARLLLAALVPALVSCVQTSFAPDPGPCTEVGPVADWGDLDIGHCLAGPLALRFIADPADPARTSLLVLNSNRDRNFQSGSLLALDWDRFDPALETQRVDQLARSARALPALPTAFDVQEALAVAAVATRSAVHEESDERDASVLLDLGNLDGLDGWDDGERSVGALPAVRAGLGISDVGFFGGAGMGVTVNTRSSDLVFFDLGLDPPAAFDVAGRPRLSPAEFADVDGSGSSPQVQHLAVDANRAPDAARYVLRFVDGTRILMMSDRDPEDAGNGGVVQAFLSSEDHSLRPAGGAPEWSPGDVGLVDGRGVAAASLYTVGLQRVLLVEARDEDGEPSILRAVSTELGREWVREAEPLLQPTPTEWDAAGVGEPSAVFDGADVALFYAGGEGSVGGLQGARSIGRIVEDEGGFEGPGEVIWTADLAGYPGGEVHGPAALLRRSLGGTLLFFSVWQGGVRDIGLALSEDGGDFELVAAPLLPPADPLDWDATGRAYPAVAVTGGELRMWYWGQGPDGVWRIGVASSWDARRWSVDPVPLAGFSGLAPRPLTALDLRSGGYYRIERDSDEPSTEVVLESEDFEGSEVPLRMQVVGGAQFGAQRGHPQDRDGVRSPSVVVDPADSGRLLLAYGSDGLGLAESRNGTEWERLGRLEVQGQDLEELADPALLANPDGTLELFFSARSGGENRGIYRAPRQSELVYGPAQAVAMTSAEWESDGRRAPAPIWVDSRLELFYEGWRGTESSIGHWHLDGSNWERVEAEGPSLAPGPAGSYDDVALRAPGVLYAEGEYRLWYQAEDGLERSIGLATKEAGGSWARHRGEDGFLRPVLRPGRGYHRDGVGAPSPLLWDGLLHLWTEGDFDGIPRIGAWISAAPGGDVFGIFGARTTTGDTFTIETTRGDTEDLSTLGFGDLDNPIEVDGRFFGAFNPLDGLGVARVAVRPDGELAAVLSRRAGVVYLVDLAANGAGDGNVYDLEAVLDLITEDAVGNVSARFSSDGQTLYVGSAPGGSGGGPEALLVFDLAAVDDDSDDQVLDDALRAVVALDRGAERDVGDRSSTNLGPADLLLGPSAPGAGLARFLYVDQYNNNSVAVVDLFTGSQPRVVEVIDTLGEEPIALALTPDERWLVVAHLVGELDGSEAHSTLSIIDLDPASPDYRRVVTRIRNRGSR